jgi:hypothetical protein
MIKLKVSLNEDSIKEVIGLISKIVKLYLFNINERSIDISKLTIIKTTITKIIRTKIIRKLNAFCPDSSFSNKKLIE